MNEFFVVTKPGLEDITLAEIQEWYPDLTGAAEHGGVTIHAPLAVGLSFNLTLKTATRVLLRVTRFSCRDFPKLFKRISSFAWHELVDPACEIEVSAATRMSRLKIKKRIEETGAEAWSAFQKAKGVKVDPKRVLHLFIRLHEDQCTISVDTSGERLHKRGERTHIGEAPLRESIAAALIRLTESVAPVPEKVEIFDPMAGSGTFLLEAARLREPSDKRDFAFHEFAVSDIDAPVSRKHNPQIAGLIGVEADEKTLKAAKSNLQTLNAQLIKADIFSLGPIAKGSDTERWLFCNPPYGERIKIKGSRLEFYQNLFQACAKVADPERACFLLPAAAVKGKFQLPRGWKVAAKRPFSNGGIPVIAFVFVKG